MLTRVGNMILASLALLVMFGAEAGCHSALSSSPPRLHHGPITIREIVMDLVVLVWFVGAVGLFSRKRLAWIGSLIGVGAAVFAFAVSLGTIAGLYLYPDADMERLKDFGIGGYIFTLVFIVCQVSVFFAFSVGLLIGLVRMRKELR